MLLLLSANTFAQNDVAASKEPRPSFPGGAKQLDAYLTSNIHYPSAALKDSLRGTVYVSFWIEKTGPLSDFKIIYGNKYFNHEALRVLKASPKWVPAKNDNGQPVRSNYILPVNFYLKPQKAIAHNIESKPKRGSEIRIDEPVCGPGRHWLLADENAVYTAPDYSAEFPGGAKSFHAYLAKNVRYPKQAKDNHIQGRVFITFVVEKDGSLSNFKLLRGLGYGCDEEASQVLKASPKWLPGIQSGKIVRQQYTVPIAFKL